MKLSNTNFNVLYVDPSAAASGDGSTPANALNSLPESASSVADGTCYLIRRTAAASEVRLPQGENSSMTALALIGMPKSTDEFYSLVPEEARTAWGADEADYANVKAVTNDDPWGGEGSKTLTLANCLTFFLYRVNLYREGQGAVETAINLSSNDGTASVSIERCRFGLKGFDLESSSCTSEPSYGTAMYVQCGKPLVFSLKHCVVNAVRDSGNYYEASSWAFQVQQPTFLAVSDVDVWTPAVQYGGGGDESGGMGSGDPILKFGYYNSYSGSSVCGNSNFENLRFHYLARGSYGYLPSLFYAYCGEFARLRKVTVQMETRQLGSGTPSVVAPAGILVDCENAAEYDYGDIAVTLPKVWRVDSYCNILKLTGASANSLPGYVKKVDGITVTLGTTAGVDTQNNGNYYSNYQNTDNGANYAAVRLNFGSGDGMYGGGAWEPVIVRNLTVTHPRGIALHFTGAYLKSCTLQGMLRASQATCDITSLTTWYPGYAVQASSGSTVRVGTLTLGRGNVSGHDSDPAILGSPQESTSFVFVGSCNGALMSDTRSTSTSHDNCYAVVCANEEDTGHYTMRTINAMCNTWGVARSGGAVSASLKLSNNTADGPGFLSLGRQPFGGFAVAATAGQRTLKVFVAAKGLSDLAQLSRRLLVQASIPHADGSSEVLWSCASGRWLEDASTWIGESSLSAYRLELPVSIPADCSVDVRIHVKWYSSSGYLYIDPGIVVE